jgi:hypothetical protein
VQQKDGEIPLNPRLCAGRMGGTLIAELSSDNRVMPIL